MGQKKSKQYKHLQVEHMFTFNVSDYVKDKIETEAHKQNLKPKSFYPFKYEFQDLTLGLVPFFDEKMEYTFGDMLIWKAESFGCTTGSKLASFLLENQDKIPNTWKRYKLFFPGTIWVDKDRNRFLTVLYYENNEWKFLFQSIEGFPAFSQSRYVFDCNNINPPKKLEMGKIIKSEPRSVRFAESYKS